jgi:hypothetical protein
LYCTDNSFISPEHRVYSSIERKNNNHIYPFGIIEEDVNLEACDINNNDLKRLSKKSARKTDAAISFFPENGEEFKLYLFFCEAKKPDYELVNNDYGKLIRLMNDSYNSLVIYFSKKAGIVLENLKNLFQNIIIYELNIYGNFNYNLNYKHLILYNLFISL